MSPKNLKIASGYIIGVQELRFRLMTDAGQGLLLTLGKNTPISNSDLKQWHAANIHVRVEYEGQPNFECGVVHAVRASS
jgi:hypothetical protein